MFGHICYNHRLFLLCNFSYACLAAMLSNICSCKKHIETFSDLYGGLNVDGSDCNCWSLYHRHHRHTSIELGPGYVQVSHYSGIPFKMWMSSDMYYI